MERRRSGGRGKRTVRSTEQLKGLSERQMQIQVNGKSREVNDGQSIEGLISDLDLDGRLIVVELNREIVRHTERADVLLRPGDRIEIVHFVGGG